MRRWAAAVMGIALMLGGCTEPEAGSDSPEPQGSVAGTEQFGQNTITLVVADRPANAAADAAVCWTATERQADGSKGSVNTCSGVGASRVFGVGVVVVSGCEGPAVHVKDTKDGLVSTSKLVVQGTFLWLARENVRSAFVRCRPLESDSEFKEFPISG